MYFCFTPIDGTAQNLKKTKNLKIIGDKNLRLKIILLMRTYLKELEKILHEN